MDREGARRSRQADKGTLALRAEQFSLGRIKDVLPPSVLTPENTTLDAALDLGLGRATRSSSAASWRSSGCRCITSRWRPSRSRTSRSG